MWWGRNIVVYFFPSILVVRNSLESLRPRANLFSILILLAIFLSWLFSFHFNELIIYIIPALETVDFVSRSAVTYMEHYWVYQFAARVVSFHSCVNCRSNCPWSLRKNAFFYNYFWIIKIRTVYSKNHYDFLNLNCTLIQSSRVENMRK